MHLHIAYASDDNYVQHLGASLVSLLDNNKEFEKISIHILDNNLSDLNRNRLKCIGEQYQREIVFYELKKLLDSLKKFEIPDTISITAYSRLFLSELIDSKIDKIIYADCDSIFESSLQSLWNINFNAFSIAAVEDHVGAANKTNIGINVVCRYINSGFLLMNLVKIRDEDGLNKMMNVIKKYNGKVQHHDQGVINAAFDNDIFYLHPKYNTMTSLYDFKNVQSIEDYYGATKYYSQEIITEAKENPVFIHFTPGFSKRPWIKGCRHPLQNKYWKYLSMTPWENELKQEDKRQLKYKLIEKIYWIFGYKIYKIIFS